MAREKLNRLHFLPYSQYFPWSNDVSSFWGRGSYQNVLRRKSKKKEEKNQKEEQEHKHPQEMQES